MFDSRILPAAALADPVGAEAYARVGFGEAAIDDALNGGLRRDGLHEFYAAASEDRVAAMAVTLMLAGRCDDEAPLLWLQARARSGSQAAPYASGLVDLGIDPDRITLICLPDIAGLLRAASDAVRHGGAGAVVLAVDGRASELDLTASRRLVLAAERSATMVLIARSDADPVASVAHSRWRVASAPSVALEADAPGLPVFDLTLLRQRGGRDGLDFRLEWDRDQRCFRTPLSGGLSAPSVGGAKRAGERHAA